MPDQTSHRRPVLMALAASAVLTVLIVVGSRNLEHYDAALFGYTVASVVAFGAIVFRYAIWLQRPATRVYWRRGWKLFSDVKSFANTTSAAKTIATNFVGQRFIFREVSRVGRCIIDHVGLRPFRPDYVSARVWLGSL